MRSENWGNDNENINVQLLEGTYYILVEPTHSEANTDYNLSVSATPVLDDPGNPSSTPNTLYVEELRRNRSKGFVTNGLDDYDEFGRSLAVGDLNQDGELDLIIGAGAVTIVDPEDENPSGPDIVINGVDFTFKSIGGYVLYAQQDGFPYPIDLASPDPNKFSVLEGKIEGLFATTEAGFASAAADINHDGIDDLVIGAPGANTHDSFDAGKVHFVYGTENGFPANVKLDELDEQQGFTITGKGDYDELGFAVSDAGDVNKDGIDDVVMGAPGTDEAYVLFGRSNFSFPARFSVEDFNGENGFRMFGNEGDETGYSVSGQGDINGDGVDDLMIQSASGRKTHVVFGRSGSFASSLDLNQLEVGEGLTILNDNLVTEVNMQGDYNGDGLKDMAFTGPSATTHVVYNKPEGLDATIDLENLAPEDGHTFEGIGGALTKGDFDGDGIDDLIIGTPRASIDGKNSVGEVLVLYGSPEGLTNDIDNLTHNNEGYRIVGENSFDWFGYKVESADVNGDGKYDILASAKEGPNGTKSGYVALIYGQNQFSTAGTDPFVSSLDEASYNLISDDLMTGFNTAEGDII